MVSLDLEHWVWARSLLTFWGSWDTPMAWIVKTHHESIVPRHYKTDGRGLVGLHVDDEAGNQLLQYLKHQSPEVLSRVAQAVTPEIKQIISQNVQGLIGVLPSDGFNVQVTTDRENLAGLLASAMMTGYFLRQMEQRMEMDASLMGTLFPDEDRD